MYILIINMVTKRKICTRFTVLVTSLTVLTVTLVCLASKWRPDLSSDDCMKARLKGSLEANDPDLVDHIRRTALKPPSLLEYNLTTNNKEMWMGKSYSWPYINALLKEVFRNHRGGFFVEAGALNGEFLSNTLRLEQELGWSGLLVEPDIYNYKELLSKQRKAWSSNSCLSNKTTPQQVVLVSTRKNNFKISIEPLVARGSSYLLDYKKQLISGGPIESFYNYLENSYYKVQCYPLFTFLLALNVTVVDFLSLDIQGSEEDVFETLPLDKIFIRSVVIENVKFEGLDYKFVKRMNEKGFYLYDIAFSGPDYFFINKNDSYLMKFSKKSRHKFQELIDKGIEISVKFI